MRNLRTWIVRFGGLFNKQRKDRELDEEIESHLQLHIEDNLRLGMTSEEARRHALIKLGGIESTKEAYRDQRGLPVLESLLQDIRYGARMLRKNPRSEEHTSELQSRLHLVCRLLLEKKKKT